MLPELDKIEFLAQYNIRIELIDRRGKGLFIRQRPHRLFIRSLQVLIANTACSAD